MANKPNLATTEGLMQAWRNAGMSDSERKAMKRDEKVARMRELAKEFSELEKELEEEGAE